MFLERTQRCLRTAALGDLALWAQPPPALRQPPAGCSSPTTAPGNPKRWWSPPPSHQRAAFDLTALGISCSSWKEVEEAKFPIFLIDVSL